MFPSFSKPRTYSYTRLPPITEEPPPAEPHARTPSHHQSRHQNSTRFSQNIYLAVCSLVFLLIGIFIGKSRLRQHASTPTAPFALATEEKMFRQEQLFGEPSNASNAAWGALFPKRGGFFNHPDIAPERSAYAVVSEQSNPSLPSYRWRPMLIPSALLVPPAALPERAARLLLDRVRRSHVIFLRAFEARSHPARDFAKAYAALYRSAAAGAHVHAGSYGRGQE